MDGNGQPLSGCTAAEISTTNPPAPQATSSVHGAMKIDRSVAHSADAVDSRRSAMKFDHAPTPIPSRLVDLRR
jgi:hypothetical protein